MWNRTANRADDLISSGAVEAHSPKDAAAGSDVVLIVLADDDAVLSVCLGDNGVVSSLPAGATPGHSQHRFAATRFVEWRTWLPEVRCSTPP